MPAMTSIPSTRALNLMCQMLADFQPVRESPEHESNSATLQQLQRELGDAEFLAFQKDLLSLMKQMSARRAVGRIISEAVQRKKAVTDANRSRRINA